MKSSDQVRWLASYNAWMNAKLYEAAGKLSAEELARDRGAFFGSITGTLNHLVVGDTLWLQRFAGHPAAYASLQPMLQWPRPSALDQILFSDFAALSQYRSKLDAAIKNWAAEVVDEHLEQLLRSTSTKGVVSDRPFHAVVTHFFNHQTHHRGQVTTLLFQAGVDVGVTDLLMHGPNQVAATP